MVGAAVKEEINGNTVQYSSVPMHPSDTDRRMCVNDPEWECDNCYACRNYEPYDYYDERRRDAEREEQV